MSTLQSFFWATWHRTRMNIGSTVWINLPKIVAGLFQHAYEKVTITELIVPGWQSCLKWIRMALVYGIIEHRLFHENDPRFVKWMILSHLIMVPHNSFCSWLSADGNYLCDNLIKNIDSIVPLYVFEIGHKNVKVVKIT